MMIDGGFLLMLAAAAALLIEPAFGRVHCRRVSNSRPVVRRILQTSFPVLPVPADYQDLVAVAERTLERDAMLSGICPVNGEDAILG
jgi:hypothetical protein